MDGKVIMSFLLFLTLFSPSLSDTPTPPLSCPKDPNFSIFVFTNSLFILCTGGFGTRNVHQSYPEGRDPLCRGLFHTQEVCVVPSSLVPH